MGNVITFRNSGCIKGGRGLACGKCVSCKYVLRVHARQAAEAVKEVKPKPVIKEQ